MAVDHLVDERSVVDLLCVDGAVDLLVYPAFPRLVEIGAAQAAVVGVVRDGLAAAVCSAVTVSAQGQCSGRWSVGRPWGRARRAGTQIRCRRRGAPRALGWKTLARLPAARSRVWGSGEGGVGEEG